MARDVLDAELLIGDETVLEDPDRTAEALAEAGELLDEMAAWKIDLNRADAEALAGLPGVSLMDADRILRLRKAKGRIDSLADLQAAGLSAGVLDAIAPYVSVRPRRRLRTRAEIVQRWSRRLSRQVGYIRDTTGTGYLGSPDATTTRLRLQFGRHVHLGLSLEKDAGEPWSERLVDKTIGHDHAVGYVSLTDVGPIRRLTVGDFSTNAGEGLVLGQNASIGSGQRGVRIREPIRPYASTRESGFFRGVGVQTKSVFGLQASFFGSRLPVDARYDESAAQWIFSGSGLHRTRSERARKRQAEQTVFGWIAGFHRGPIRIGAAGTSTRHGVSGKVIQNVTGAGGYLSWTVPRLSFSTEVSPRGDGYAISAAVIYRASPAVDYWFEALQSPSGGLVPHSSAGANAAGRSRRETGWKAGVRFAAGDRWKGSVDVRWSRRPTHIADGPAISFGGSIEAKPSPWLAVRLRVAEYRSEPVVSCAGSRLAVRCSAPRFRRTARLQLEYVHSRTLRHRFQVEVSSGSTDPVTRHQGILLYKDLRWRPTPRLQFDGRLSFFEVSDFAARIYAYENDVLYAFSAPVFTGRGRRSYVLARFVPHRVLSIQIKYGLSIYEDVRTVGSGLDATLGPSRRDIRIQARWKIGHAAEETASSFFHLV